MVNALPSGIYHPKMSVSIQLRHQVDNTVGKALFPASQRLQCFGDGIKVESVLTSKS